MDECYERSENLYYRRDLAGYDGGRCPVCGLACYDVEDPEFLVGGLLVVRRCQGGHRWTEAYALDGVFFDEDELSRTPDGL